jgi:hypothetical protein
MEVLWKAKDDVSSLLSKKVASILGQSLGDVFEVTCALRAQI